MTGRTGAALVALALLLSGCTAEEQEPTVLPPAPSASPSLAPLPVPPEAMAETAEGAAAFARYYFEELVSRAYETLDPTVISRYNRPDCNSCDNIAQEIERIRVEQHQISGERFTIDFAEAAPTDPGEPVLVDLRLSSGSFKEIDRSGAVVREIASGSKQDAQMQVVRSNNGWLVSGIRTISR